MICNFLKVASYSCKVMKLLRKIGIYRLLYTPFAVWIIYTAWQQHIWLMAIIGVVTLFFGLTNRCMLSGKCDTEF